MFDLEDAIGAWRRPYERDRTFQRDDLDELESNLRDRVDAYVASGMSEEAAFSEALRRMGDYATLEKEYRKVRWDRSRRRAHLRRELAFLSSALANYFTASRRYLWRRKTFSLINVVGLGLGIACCLLMLVYARGELSYDHFHTNADRVYRVVADRVYDGGEVRPLAPVSPPLAPAVKRLVPEVEQAVRLFNPRHTVGRSLVRHADDAFYEERFFYADPEVFHVFTFPLVQGDPRTVLQDPLSVVLSETMAGKYFGSDDPLGRTLVLDDSLSLTVTGVMRDLPRGTHLRMDFIAPYALFEVQYGAVARDVWGFDLVHTYLLLNDRAAPQAVLQKIQAFLDTEVLPQTSRRSYRYEAALQPITEIHLHSNREWEIEPNSSALYPYALLLIALFTLVLAAVNFINLSTASIVSRAREVGVRKCLGGRRIELYFRFLLESVLLSLAATMLGSVLAWLALPALAEVTGAEIELTAIPVGYRLLVPVFAAVFIGFAAGSIPALRLAALRPAATLKGTFKMNGGGLRRGLVVFQLTVSVGLIAGTLIVHRQLEFTRARELGFDKDQILVLSTGTFSESVEALRDELLRLPGVGAVAAASGMPGGQVERMLVRPEGQTDLVPVQMLWVDHDFVETLGIDIAAGRDFSRQHGSDATAAYLINASAARAFGWNDPLGKTLTWQYYGGTREGEVIGVVSDFHTESLRQELAPLVLVVSPRYRTLAVRVEGGRLQEVLTSVEQLWKRTLGTRPFEYAFLDDSFDRLYRSERGHARLFLIFSVLAIAIAALGMAGLSAFTAEQRVKEIGVRKILGASAFDVFLLFSKDFIQLVVIACAVATPMAYLAMSRWLEHFAYHIEPGPGVFLLSGGIALGVALSTVSVHALRAALANPVDSLRYE